MSNYVADLHIHSRFSMATSKSLNVAHLAGWAMCKGIHVLGTGDYTHPKWQEELRRDLVFDETSGFYRMTGTPEAVLPHVASGRETPPLFCLQTEISSIYKRGGKVRKVHNVVLMPTLEDVEVFSKKLGAIGNINSDGRPILGLDSHDLLDLVLSVSDRAVLIPAHIWTPWFSLFGSRSGFDDIRDCFADLTEHIFALETGLSSDPDMNRLVSSLDGYALISNSDAHSGPNLGREANLFEGTATYDGMIEALRQAARRTPNEAKRGSVFKGTLEIYPEEGKYHLDGHRACGIVMTPEEAARHNDICPVCGKKLTIGVLHRVWELADRREVPNLPSEPEVHPIIPLPTVLAEIMNAGAQTKKVKEAFADILTGLGSEFAILSDLEIDEIARHSTRLAEAVRRIRQGEVTRMGGYDGEFGTVRIFTKEESRDLAQHLPKARLTPLPVTPELQASARLRSPQSKPQAPSLLGFLNAVEGKQEKAREAKKSPIGIHLTAEQEAAAGHMGCAMLVLAGPGSGKTRLLTERIAGLVDRGVSATDIIALTFSRKAAEEIHDRVSQRLKGKGRPECSTFHSLAWRFFRKQFPDTVLLGDDEALELFREAALAACPSLAPVDIKSLALQMELSRETLTPPPAGSLLEKAMAAYAARKREKGRVDYTELLEWFAAHLSSPDRSLHPREVLVDEIQDLSALQLAVLENLLPEDGHGFFGIGDPDQAIYGFRGSTGDTADRLKEIWPDLKTLALRKSFRSSQQILSVAGKAMQGAPASGILEAAYSMEATLHFFEAPNQHAEAQWMATRITSLVGATSHTLLDASEENGEPEFAGRLALSDIAVLVRLKAQIPAIAATLRQRGIPVQIPSEELFWRDETSSRILRAVSDALHDAKGEAVSQVSLIEGAAPAKPEMLAPVLLQKGVVEPAYLEGGAWKRLCRAYARHGSWKSLLEDIRWLDEADLLRQKAEAVSILTLHASKGLEFRAVFMPGMEDGILPLRPKEILGSESGRAVDIEEERRLLYVGLTRASQALFLSCAAERTIYGTSLQLKPSRFLADILSAFSRTRLHVRNKKKVVAQTLWG